MEREFIDIPIQEIPQTTKEETKFMGLLNDYLLKYYAEYGNRNLYCELGGWSLLNVHETVIISKKFGFIKRLVENNKIDTQNLITYMNGTSLTFNKVPSTDCTNIDKTWNDFYTECLLMLLSIQDNPIEFLISILR